VPVSGAKKEVAMSSSTLESAAHVVSAKEEHAPEIETDRSGSVLRVQLNRPAKRNAMTFNMYATIAELLNQAVEDEGIRVVILYGAGESFTAGNDLEDFLRNPPTDVANSPQGRFIAALINFDKPLIAAVHGAAVGSGTTVLLHCDFVYAAENTTFRMPFIDLALVPELGTSYSFPAQIGYIAAAELVMLGMPFDARRAAELGLVTRVVSDHGLMATAMETAQALSQKPADALRACKRLLKRGAREQTETAVRIEDEEYRTRLRSEDAKEAMTAFFERRRPDFTKTKTAAVSH
jgi:enoyl-CoA hydratase/carnithine racemase